MAEQKIMDSEEIRIHRNKQNIQTMMENVKVGDSNLYKVFLDPKLVELMVNDDGGLWIERLGEAMKFTGTIVNPITVETLIKTISGYHKQILNSANPICEAEFPLDDSRFEGTIPPITKRPTFCLRKKASSIYILDEYVESGIMTPRQKELIEQCIVRRYNMLVCGGTGSGKTTLINAIIERMVHLCPDDRIFIIEDTGEIQCTAKNKNQMRSDENTSMTRLLRVALRYRPDRILVGEVRGGEALDLLDAWNTGHPGGMATVHANSARSALDRIKSLIQRNPAHPREGLEHLVAESVNVVINIDKDKELHSRKIKSILAVKGYDANKQDYVVEDVK